MAGSLPKSPWSLRVSHSQRAPFASGPAHRHTTQCYRCQKMEHVGNKLLLTQALTYFQKQIDSGCFRLSPTNKLIDHTGPPIAASDLKVGEEGHFKKFNATSESKECVAIELFGVGAGLAPFSLAGHWLLCENCNRCEHPSPLRCFVGEQLVCFPYTHDRGFEDTLFPL